jgi:hypothetical protein
MQTSLKQKPHAEQRSAVGKKIGYKQDTLRKKSTEKHLHCVNTIQYGTHTNHVLADLAENANS